MSVHSYFHTSSISAEDENLKPNCLIMENSHSTLFTFTNQIETTTVATDATFKDMTWGLAEPTWALSATGWGLDLRLFVGHS